jgi:hypothetical protein
MTRCFATFLALAAAARLAAADIPDTGWPWTNAPAGAPAKPAAKTSHSAPGAQTAAQLQAALDQLTQTNHELLDLLKKQQAVLEDIQYDRRLQSRQIQSLEDRLEEALADKHELEQKVDNLEVQASARPATTSPTETPTPPAPTPTPSVLNPGNGSAQPASAPPLPAPDMATPAVDTPPPVPESYLPPPPEEGPPGTPSWHRIFTLKGGDNKQTDVFLVRGRTWRVLWHNQDKPGKLYANTSALFISAFPRDDTIPQKVCSKLGSGGDSTELPGPGNYYLKIEASGGDWELAVEDYR